MGRIATGYELYMQSRYQVLLPSSDSQSFCVAPQYVTRAHQEAAKSLQKANPNPLTARRGDSKWFHAALQYVHRAHVIVFLLAIAPERLKLETLDRRIVESWSRWNEENLSPGTCPQRQP